MHDLKRLKGLRFIKKREGDWNETSTIKIKQEDLPDALSALQWACLDQLNFNLTPAIVAPICEVELPGRFSVLLDQQIVADLVETWKLLRNRYPKHEDIFKDDIKWIVPTMAYLLDKTAGKDVELPAWISRILKIKKENNHE